jgi:putative flavoprotein involved in K+ transport
MTNMELPVEVLIVGGGPAGLAAARMISEQGLRVRLLESGDRIGARWANHYDSLRLNSGRVISSLPGMRMERRLGRWVSRADFLDYLDRYARSIEATIEYGVRVEQIEQAHGGWVVRAADREWTAAAVVVATGLNAIPKIPNWAQHDFDGEVIHSDAYGDSCPYRDRDILLVGSGSSAHDIALNLIEGGAARVRMSLRTPPLLVPKQVLGLSSAILSTLVKHGPPVGDRLNDAVSFWLHHHCFPDADRLLGEPPVGLATALRERGHGATLEVGLLAALRRGDVEVVAAVNGIENGEVLLADGSRLRPDAVILATGYRSGLESMLGPIGVLDANGRPLAHGARTLPHAPGLYFLGFRLPAGQLPDFAIDSRRIARRLSRLSQSAVGSGRREAELLSFPSSTLGPDEGRRVA